MSYLMKVDYRNMSKAVRRDLLKEREKNKKKKCPGGDKCPYLNLLCTECKLNDDS